MVGSWQPAKRAMNGVPSDSAGAQRPELKLDLDDIPIERTN